MSLATWAALPTSVWTRIYAVTTGTDLLVSCRPRRLQRLCRRDGGMWRLVRRARGCTGRCPPRPTVGWAVGCRVEPGLRRAWPDGLPTWSDEAETRLGDGGALERRGDGEGLTSSL